MADGKMIQAVHNVDVLRLRKALTAKGYRVKLPLYSYTQKCEMPVVCYDGQKQEYKVAFSCEPEKWEEQMRIAVAVILSGEDVLREYDALSSVDELFETYPLVKGYYQQISKDMDL